MLDTSFILLLVHTFLYVFIPIFAGVLFIFILFWNTLKWIELYISSWFFGLAIIIFFLYNIQFFHFWVWVREYAILMMALCICFITRVLYYKERYMSYLWGLLIPVSYSKIRDSFMSLPKYQKYFTVFFIFYIVIFYTISFLYNVSFPTYFDDTFGNWNLAAIHIFIDGGFFIFWERDEILGYGWRINYPIYISIFKALIWDFVGWWYDSYQNLFQYISFFFFSLFLFHISYKRSNNLFYGLLPVFVVSGMWLLFFHIIDGYMDLACGIYGVFTIYYIYRFLQTSKVIYFFIWILFACLLINIKNDAFVVYFPWIMIALFSYLIISSNFKKYFKIVCDKNNAFITAFIGIFFFIPPIFVRWYHWFALNPQANDGFENDRLFHPEIFTYFDDIFLKADNYNLVLLLVWVIFLYRRKSDTRFILFAFLAIFGIFLLVFLCTSNYRWVLDQTTVNRVFLSSFLILLSFISFFMVDNSKSR